MTALTRVLAGSRPIPLRSASFAASLAIVLGLIVASGLWYVAAALALGLTALVVGLINWRWSLIGLLAYLPVSGVLIVATYPSGAAALAKDFMFVIPAYAGFLAIHLAQRKRVGFDGAPVALLAILALLVVIGAFYPAVIHQPLVALVGIKTWLLYVPLMFLGYHLIRDTDDLDRVFRVMCLAAIVPAVVGVVEAVLIYSGKSAFVYSFYGGAASSATQDFAQLDVGSASLLRVPSTFSFVAQYYVFTACMVAVAYAWWQAGRGPARLWRAGVWALVLLAALTSGARGAFVFVPLLILLILLLDRRLGPRSVGVVLAGVAGLVFMLNLIGTDFSSLIIALRENASTQWGSVIVDGAQQAYHHFFVGLGTGADTNAARHVADQSTIGVNGVWVESWWAKTALELGIAGLILSVALYATIIGAGIRQHRRLVRPELRSASAAILALLIWTAIYNFKSSYTDIDPLNVYFWFLAGILYKLGTLDRQAQEQSQSEFMHDRTAGDVVGAVRRRTPEYRPRGRIRTQR